MTSGTPLSLLQSGMGCLLHPLVCRPDHPHSGTLPAFLSEKRHETSLFLHVVTIPASRPAPVPLS